MTQNPAAPNADQAIWFQSKSIFSFSFDMLQMRRLKASAINAQTIRLIPKKPFLI